MATKGISGVAIAFTLGGIVLLYSGLRGKKITTTVKDLLAGNITGDTDPSLAVSPPAASGGTAAGGHVADSGDVTTGAQGGGSTANQAIGRLLAASYGWYPGPNWDALVKLWIHESNWDNTAMNPSSGAYGIAQALPETKYPMAGRSPQAGGSSNATVQIAWGLKYIRERYGNPIAAWQHELAVNWY